MGFMILSLISIYFVKCLLRDGLKIHREKTLQFYKRNKIWVFGFRTGTIQKAGFCYVGYNPEFPVSFSWVEKVLLKWAAFSYVLTCRT